MADNDMATSANGSFDAMASYARLSERVENQGKDIIDLRSNMNTGFQTVNTNLATLANEFRNSSKTPWPVIWSAAGVCSAILITIGTFFYGVLNKDMTRLDVSVATLGQTAISRAEWVDNATRAAENRQRLESAIAKLAENAVGRNELTQMVTEYRDYKARIENELGKKLDRPSWEERNLNRDHEIASIQRQIDQQRADFQTFANSLGNGRDFIQDLKSELARLRDQLADIRARQYQRMGPP